MNIKISEIGQPKTITTKFGPKEKSYIKTAEGEYAGKFLNYWISPATKSWAVGQEIEVEGIDKRDYTAQDGTLKTSYDLRLPKFGGLGDVTKKMEEIQNAQTKQLLILQQILSHVTPKKKDDYPEFAGEPDFETPNEVGPDEEIPF